MKKFNQFLLESKKSKKINLSELKEKLKGKEMDFVKFNGDQNVLDIDKLIDSLKEL